MDSLTDQQLLRDYTGRRSEAAFAELVRRHVDFVYSAAVRMVRDAHLAEDVTQDVFLALARSAPQLTGRPVLSGWLHRTAQYLAAKAVRSDVRRRAREQEAAAMNELLAAEPAAAWECIAPHLDAALGELNEPERDALLLRYFERKSAREMAQILGTSEEAAQKRVSRAVEHLREFFAKRGVTVGASGLVVVISAHAVQAAPVGLAAAISTAAAVAGTAIVTTATATATQAIAMTTLQKTIIAATLAAAVGTGIYEARQASIQRSQAQALREQQAPLLQQLRQLQGDRDVATNRLAALADELAQLKTNHAELLKLRGQVANLRADAAPADPSLKTWVRQVTLLKQKLEQMPGLKIPELQFATEKDWAYAVSGADLTTEDGVREALSKLREGAENTFLNEMMKAAFKKYLAAHDGILPADLYQLKPYFDAPVTDAMLQRYKLLQTGKPDNNADLVRLEVFADEDYDSSHGMSINGAWGGRFNRVQQAVEAAAGAFAKANHGQLPTDSSQLTPYLKKPIEAATIQKYLAQMAAEPPPPEKITLLPVLSAYAEANSGHAPDNPWELAPYLATPEQQAAFLKMEQLPPEAATLLPALKAYLAAHNGQAPKSAADMLPYLTTPEQQAAYSILAQKFPTKGAAR